MSTLNVLTLPNNITLADVFCEDGISFVTVAGLDGDDAIVSTKTAIVRIARAELPPETVAGLRLYVDANMVVVGNNLDSLTSRDDQKCASAQGCITSGDPLSMV